MATTLAAQTLVSTEVSGAVKEKTWLSSVNIRWVLENMTAGSQIGPLMVGVAHSDYSDAEIEEWIESTGSWDEGDLVQQEVAKRKIRRVGVFETPQSVEDAVTLNDGRALRTKCGWYLLAGQKISIWVYNMGQSDVASSAPNIFAEGFANLWPR